MSMPDGLNEKELKFIEHVARGESAISAAKKSGYSASYSRKSARLLKKPEIAQAVADIQAQARQRVSYDLAQAMSECLDVIAFSKLHKNSMSYCKAVELRAKLSGLLVDRIAIEKVDLKGALEEARSRVITMIATNKAAGEPVHTVAPALPTSRWPSLDE